MSPLRIAVIGRQNSYLYLASKKAIPQSTIAVEKSAMNRALSSRSISLAARENDGASAPDAYRPRTKPGVYIPTAMPVGWQAARMTPFVLASPSQFRAKPPPSLKSAEWARDYNEIKQLGAKNNTKRTPRQTEDARFWLLVGPSCVPSNATADHHRKGILAATSRPSCTPLAFASPSGSAAR